jgi:hypothetical protein
MTDKPSIQNRAMGKPPRKPSVVAKIYDGMSAMMKQVAGLSDRLKLLEQRSLPRDGEPGKPGENGRGLSGALIDRDGCLILTYSDGESINLGRVVGADAEKYDPPRDGVGIADMVIDDNGCLAVTLSDGHVKILGRVVGKDGEDVGPVDLSALDGLRAEIAALKDAPATVQNGRGISAALIDADGNLVLTFSDGATDKVGRVVGRDGQDAQPPTPAKDGVGIAGAAIREDGKLVLSLTSGAELNVGRVVGRDGEDAQPVDLSIIDALRAEIAALREDMVALRPEPVAYDDRALRLIAEAANTTASDAIQRVMALQAEPKPPTSFVITGDGDLVAVRADGSKESLGHVVGKPGDHGTTIANATVDAGGCLVLSLSDGRHLNAGIVKGKDGVTLPGIPGRSIVSGKVTEAGDLVLRMSDGAEENVGHVSGKDGEPGKPGETGKGIEIAEITEDGNLQLSYTDGTQATVGRVVGDDGEPGKSIKGDPGRNGVGIKAIDIVDKRLEVEMTDGSKKSLGRVVGRDGEPGRVVEPLPLPHPFNIVEVRQGNLSPADLPHLSEIEVAMPDGSTVRLYGRI